jgi:regulator of sigma E protease
MELLSEYTSPALRILATIAGIGFLIFIHELGHFLLAKRNGVRVDLFSLGFGPVICSWRKGIGFRRGSSAAEAEERLKAEKEGGPDKAAPALGQTEYRLAWIPLGGFVKMAGEPLGEARTGAPDELSSKTPWQRFEIFVAGTTMNFIFAFPSASAPTSSGRTSPSRLPAASPPTPPNGRRGCCPGTGWRH